MTTADSSADPGDASSPERSPGQMLRAARESRGVHLAVLSMALKVPTRQLEALEQDDHQAFKGMAFVRALAQSVCRHLGMDPAPVLAGLPQSASPLGSLVSAKKSTATLGKLPLHHSGTGRNVQWPRRVLWLAVLMLVGIAVMLWWPTPQSQSLHDDSASLSPRPVAEAQDSPQQVTVAPDAASAAIAPGSAPVASASLANPATPAVLQEKTSDLPRNSPGSLLVQARADVWVEIRNNEREIVLKRQIRLGESVSLELQAPVYLYVSRAESTDVSWRGKPVDLVSRALNNETRMQINP